MSVVLVSSATSRTEKARVRPKLSLKTAPSDRENMRSLSVSSPPNLPLPTPTLPNGDFLRGQSTPIQSPIASPFRAAPLKLMETLVVEETSYLAELLVLQKVIQEKLLGHDLDCLAGPIEKLIDLTCELKSKLSAKTTYFSDPQKDCLVHFSKVAPSAYQAYLQSYTFGWPLSLAQSAERIRLLDLLHTLTIAGDPDRDLDWLLRRPLSRVRSYSTLYKKLLHSSDDATDMFLAYETFHSLLIEARETLDTAKEQSKLAEISKPQPKPAQRSVSAESTSTQSSSTSKISPLDEIAGLQASIDCSQCKDIFSLAATQHTLDLVPRTSEMTRAIVNRENFQLTLQKTDSEIAIDCLVEMILFTDQIVLIKPTFQGPQLLFPPLLRGVFHVTYLPSEPRMLELDIVGRQTLRLTASSSEARQHWYELLLACEDFQLDAMPAAPSTLANHVGKKAHMPWMPLAPARMPPTPPHSANSSSFGMTAPLRVIRENSQLSICGFSDASGRTPDAKDHPPFQFDISEDEQTPKAIHFSNPMDKPLPTPLMESLSVTNKAVPQVPSEDKSDETLASLIEKENLPFPEPPRRSPKSGSVSMTKSKSVDLFSATSYTDRFLSAPTLDFRSKTVQPVASSRPGTPTADLGNAAPLSETDLDFTKDEEFDETILDLPTLPAFDFGDGVRRPSSVALNFSPNTMSNFGIPVRKVEPPKPMQIPDVAPLRISPEKAKISDSLAQRRLGSEMQSLGSLPPLNKGTTSPKRDEILSTMAECYSWINGTWTPILLDDVDNEGKMKTVRSSRITIFFSNGGNGSLEIYDQKDAKVINVYVVYAASSIIRDDPCDISVGFDVGLDKVYYMFRAETPDKANALQHALNQAKFAAPQNGFVTPKLPMTPLWPEMDSSASLVESLKIKLYLFDQGKWINKGSARLTIRMVAQTRNRRITLTGKTKKNERVMLVDYIAAAGDCDAISKTSISLKTKQDTYMMQFKGGEKERGKILAILVD